MYDSPCACFFFPLSLFLFVFTLLQLLVPRYIVSVMLSVCLLIMLLECVSVHTSVRISAAMCAAVMERLISMTVILRLLHVGEKQTCLFVTLENAVSELEASFHINHCINLSIDFSFRERDI